MSFLGGKERFQPYKIAAYILAKFLLRPDRALSALTGLTLTSLAWGPHPLPMGLSFCLGCIAGVPASSCGTAVDVSGHGPTPRPGLVTMALLCHGPARTRPGLCLTLVPLTRPDPESHSHTAGLAWPQPIPVLVPREVPSAWGSSYPTAPTDPAPDWRWDGPGWEASTLLPPWGPPAGPRSPGSSWPLWHPVSYLRLSQALSQHRRARPTAAQDLALQTWPVSGLWPSHSTGPCLNTSFYMKPSQGGFGAFQGPPENPPFASSHKPAKPLGLLRVCLSPPPGSNPRRHAPFPFPCPCPGSVFPEMPPTPHSN